LHKKGKKKKTKGKKQAAGPTQTTNSHVATHEPQAKRIKLSAKAKSVDPLLADDSSDDENAAAVAATTSVAKPTMPNFSSVQDELDSSDDDEPAAITAATAEAMDEAEEVEQDEESDEDDDGVLTADNEAVPDQDDSDEEVAKPVQAKSEAVVNFDDDNDDDGDSLDSDTAPEASGRFEGDHDHMSASINPDDHVGIPRQRETRQDKPSPATEAFVSIPNSVGKLAANMVLESTCHAIPSLHTQSSVVSPVLLVGEGRKGRDFTVSMALPGSIVENAQSPELRSYLAGQIARAAVVFNVDEIIVFKENTSKPSNQNTQGTSLFAVTPYWMSHLLNRNPPFNIL
jgi:hypothetical protein